MKIWEFALWYNLLLWNLQEMNETRKDIEWVIKAQKSNGSCCLSYVGHNICNLDLFSPKCL